MYVCNLPLSAERGKEVAFSLSTFYNERLSKGNCQGTLEAYPIQTLL